MKSHTIRQRFTLEPSFIPMKIVIALLLLLWPLSQPALAQDEATPTAPDTGIWVTTQDFVSMRVGPGTAFERIAVVPPAETLPAIGRTAETLWIQVWYNGQRGWIAQRLLVWSGDVVSLPVDGINPVPYVRLIGVLGVTIRETPLYGREIVPEDQVGTIPAGTVVELTARLGSSGYFQLQIRHQGQLYWVGSWDIRVINGRVSSLLDTTYLYPYGRLVTQLGRDISGGMRAMTQIEDIWLRLGGGQGISCGFVPGYTQREVTDTDVNQENIFSPAVVALDSAIVDINAAISRFEDACTRTTENDYFLTQQDVENALVTIDDARRSLNLSSSLLNALAPRDPLVGVLREEN